MYMATIRVQGGKGILCQANDMNIYWQEPQPNAMFAEHMSAVLLGYLLLPVRLYNRHIIVKCCQQATHCVVLRDYMAAVCSPRAVPEHVKAGETCRTCPLWFTQQHAELLPCCIMMI